MADLTTPRMCVMRPRLAALSFMLPSGSCSGIPAPLKKEFEHESKICARQTIVPTPVDKLYERISVLNHPTGMTHVVEKQSGKLYISKQMVKTCLSKPISIKQRSVEFVHPMAICPGPLPGEACPFRYGSSPGALFPPNCLPQGRVRASRLQVRGFFHLSLNCISKLSLPQVEIN